MSRYLKAYSLGFLVLNLLACNQTVANQPMAEPRKKLTIAVMGDVTLGNHFLSFDKTLEQERGLSDQEIAAYPFLNVRAYLAKADLVLANYEGTFTNSQDKTEKNFNFRAKPKEVAKLVSAGIDLVSIANNHAFDYGEQGLQDTRQTLEQAKIAYFGAGTNLAEARQYRYINKADVGVCALGYLFLGSYKIEPSIIWAQEQKAGVAGVAPTEENPEATMQQMLQTDLHKMAQDVRCEVKIVFFHWGREGTYQVQGYQRRLAQVAADSGADFIFGSHPHVLQAIEHISRADGAKIPVAYSLGNFVFAGNWNPKRKDSALLLATIEIKKNNRQRQVEIVPVKTDLFPKYPFQPYPQTPPKAKQLIKRIDCRLPENNSEYCLDRPD